MYTIEDIRNKKVAIHNDSTLEELKEVLRVAFPKDLCEILGVQEYYFAHRHDLHHRECSSKKPKIPIQSVKDFIKQIRGEEMKDKQEYELVDFKIEDLKEGSMIESTPLNTTYEVQGIVGRLILSIVSFPNETKGMIRTNSIDNIKIQGFKLQVPKLKIEKIQGFEVREYLELPLVEVSDDKEFPESNSYIAELIEVESTKQGAVFMTINSGEYRYCRPVPKDKRNFINFEE